MDVASAFTLEQLALKIVCNTMYGTLGPRCSRLRFPNG